MQTRLAPRFEGTSEGEEAESILRKCVHCGFCTATLPDLPAARRRARRPARAHLPDEAGARGRGGDALDPDAPRPVPDLPQLRKHLPVGRAVRGADRHRATDRRRAGRAPCAREGGALAAEGRADLAALHAGDEARPDPATAGAGSVEEQGAAEGRRARAPLADARASAQGADADGLRAAVDGAQHQQRDGAGARRSRHSDARRGRGRLLRRDPAAPERPRRRARRHAPQHRRPGGRAWPTAASRRS